MPIRMGVYGQKGIFDLSGRLLSYLLDLHADGCKLVLNL